MRLLCCMTKPALCSTRSTAQPVSSRTASIRSPSRSASVSSRPDAGSSRSRSRGSSTIARANSTIRAMPIGSEPASSLRTAVRPHRSSTSFDALRRRSRSRDRRVGNITRSARKPPPPPCHSSAASTLSSTDSQPKVWTRWNVRRRPRRERCTADFDVTSLPARTTRPSLGSRTPEMTSKSVVLPAPFGPMMPSTSPALASRLTPLNAAMPPNRTLIPSSERMMSVRAASPGSPCASRSTSAVKARPLRSRSGARKLAQPGRAGLRRA